MRRLIVILGLVAVISFCFLCLAEALDKETEAKPENLREIKNFSAGYDLFKTKEAKLKSLKGRIDEYIQEEIPKDGKVSVKEINTLNEMFEGFAKEKEKADKRLKLYAIRTKTVTGYQELEERVLMYQTHDRGNKIRKIFAELTGKDLLVECTICMRAVVVGSIIAILGSLLLIFARRLKNDTCPKVFGIIVFILGLLVFLWLGIGVF